MNRTTFLIDGFNLYHSLLAASRDLGGVSTKWLNIDSLCSSYLHIIGGGASLIISKGLCKKRRREKKNLKGSSLWQTLEMKLQGWFRVYMAKARMVFFAEGMCNIN